MMKNILNVISNAILVTGIVMMVGAAGAMDMAVESGAVGGVDLKTMLIGFVLTIAGLALAHRREKSGKRKVIREQDKTVYRITGRMAG